MNINSCQKPPFHNKHITVQILPSPTLYQSPFMVMVARPKKWEPEKSCYYQTLLEFISLLDVSSIFCICIYYSLILASA